MDFKVSRNLFKTIAILGKVNLYIYTPMCSENYISNDRCSGVLNVECRN